MLSEAAETHRNRIQSSVPRDDSSDDEVSACPLLDCYVSKGGPDTLKTMTNFTESEFDYIWTRMNTHVQSTWNVGRGRKSKHQPKDVLFMTLTVLKHPSTWQMSGLMFDMKGPTFQKLIMGYLEIIGPELYKFAVTRMNSKYTMKKEMLEGQVFSTFDFCRYATDVTFQQTNRPSGNMREGKLYFSGKHKLYGYKTEMSVIPRGYAIGCSKHRPGSISDIDIFYDNLDFHESSEAKGSDMAELDDDGELNNTYPNQWGILGDKGYKGGTRHIRMIHPDKKPINGTLTADEKVFNEELSSDRIIVENYFGRLSSLWTVMSNKYKWNEDRYDLVFRTCVALTNIHVKFNPLRDSDQSFYKSLQNYLVNTGDNISRKRARSQELYRDRVRRRLETEFDNMPGYDSM